MSFFSFRNCLAALFVMAALSFSDAHASSGLSKNKILLRTDAIQQSQNTVSTFALRFSAAVRAPVGSAEQVERVREVSEVLTDNFSITLILDPMFSLEAHDFPSLLALIETLSAPTTFNASLIGNFSVENYFHDTCSKRRYVDLQTLEYVVQTDLEGNSSLTAALDQFQVIETRPDVFKIRSLVVTVIGNIPFCCLLPPPPPPPPPQT